MEAIWDDPSHSRVKVPERMVSYVSGAVKKTRNGKVNSLRRNGRDAYGKGGNKRQKPKKNKPQHAKKRKNVSSKLSRQ